MKRSVLLSLSFLCVAAMASAQIALPPGASAQAPQDPGYQALIAMCKTPPPTRGGGPGRAGAARGRGGATGAQPTTFPPPPAAYTVSAIPGVIAAGQTWTKVWEVSGNNADGIIEAPDGDVMIAQNHNSAVVTLEPNGKTRTVYKDTHTGGALSRNTKGALFIVERGLRQRIEELAPQRRVFADKLANGDPLDCLGGVINDLTADSKGGVYFTMGGLFHADPRGKVTRYGENLNTNGVILSPDEKTLYVTNGTFGAPAGTIAAFDVQPDGSLKNQREFVKLPSGSGDGLTVDAKGNLYVTAGPNVHVVSPQGKVLGSIPTPYGVISAAFAGKDKKTLYTVVSLIDPNRLQHAYIYSIPMVAQGFKGRAK